MWTVEDGIRILRERKAKITAQRIAILKNLEGRMDHPSAEIIYNELREDFPTLSFATIYGTTHLLAEAGLISVLTIDDKRVLFDSNADPHAHFRCTACSFVEDVPFGEQSFDAVLNAIPHRVENVQLFLYGLCAACAQKQAN